VHSYAQSWPFSFVTSGTNVQWRAPIAVDSTAPVFYYALVTTQLDVLIGPPFGSGVRIRMVPSESVNSQGFRTGPLPVELFRSPVQDMNHVFSFDFHAFIGADGFARVEASDFLFGQYAIDINRVVYYYDVLGLRGAGTLSVTAIPEPSSLWLLALGSWLLGARLRTHREPWARWPQTMPRQMSPQHRANLQPSEV
jgi:hypothetical protein